MTASIVSTPAPREKCDLYQGRPGTISKISTHAPPTGCDNGGLGISGLVAISTPAPHTWCDITLVTMEGRTDISTHTPHEGGATLHCGQSRDFGIISIHAPYVGCDRRSDGFVFRVFQLPHPMGARPQLLGHGRDDVTFQFPRPMRGATI